MSPDRDTTYACTSEIKKSLAQKLCICILLHPKPMIQIQFILISQKNTASNQGELQQIIKKTQSSQGINGGIKHEAAEGRK